MLNCKRTTNGYIVHRLLILGGLQFGDLEYQNRLRSPSGRVVSVLQGIPVPTTSRSLSTVGGNLVIKCYFGNRRQPSFLSFNLGMFQLVPEEAGHLDEGPPTLQT